MYNELYAAWRREIEETSLGRLPPDFYARIAEYLSHIRQEDMALEKKTVKINLLDCEAQNVRRMLEELLRARYKKLVKTITQSQKLPSELLTLEEAKMGETFVSFTDAYQKFAKNLTQGQIVKPDLQVSQQAQVQTPAVAPAPTSQVSHRRNILRFSKSIPAIIGVDMKTYGPFKVEDVASLPAENAKMLVKQGLAVLVEVS